MSETERIFDAHVHIIDPRFPLVPNDGFLPEPFTVDDYRRRTSGLAIAGGAVVSGSFQGVEQGYLRAALAALGPNWVGVTQLPADTDDRTLRELHAAGIRAIRFNIRRGGSAGLDELDGFARRVFDLVGWHTELYIDARQLDAPLTKRIAALPAVSIDHLGLHADGLPRLLELVEQGVMVKATGFGRVELDPVEAMQRIVDINPQVLMVGTDLPSTRARRPFEDADIDIIRRAVPAAMLSAVLWDNAARRYLR
ncbi:amidohydrolase family protein [Curtobacterium ammoniigenes]|uniref:amidohydrolase family protein n=1 Tax=Curtobacterium ammoniigenes TaxID=395387 RepID=UPI0008314EDD|nr:amidohydrolase family protein [Curtobacterium ammoniigenes]